MTIVSDERTVQCMGVADKHGKLEQTPTDATPPQRATALCDYMDELIESLRKDVPAALKDFDEDAIHDTRVATRRLKAAIDLLQPVLSAEHRKPVAKAGKKLRRRLGPMRDLDVMINGLDVLRKLARHRQAADWLQERLIATRGRLRIEAKSNSSPNRLMARLGSWWGLREDVLDASEQSSALLKNSLHLQLDQFAEHASWLAGYQRDPDRAEKRDPHLLRIAGKALRYTLEMAKREGFALPGDVAKTFKKLQDALGDWHDLVVLTERAMQETIDALLAHHDPAMQRRILALARLTLDRADAQLRRFNVIWSEKGDSLLAVIRSAVPLTVGVRELQTDRDLPDSEQPLIAGELSESAPAAS